MYLDGGRVVCRAEALNSYFARLRSDSWLCDQIRRSRIRRIL